jgi:hypothetical protein
MAETDDPGKLEREVVEERARLNATLDEIQNRLTPGQLVDEVLRHGRGAGSDFVANLGRTLTANPVPAALVGVGLLWLLLAPKPTPPAADAPAVPDVPQDHT